MHKRIAFTLGIAFCFCIHAQCTETIAAYVNEVIITRLSVQKLVRDENITYDQALDLLIEQQLLLQDFNNKKGKISQLQLDIQTSSIVQEHFNGNRNAFVRVLQMQGKSLLGLQTELRTSIILNVMRQQKAQSKYGISPKEIRSYYNSHRREFFVPARYFISQSGFGMDSKMPQTEIKKSDKLRALIDEGVALNAITQQLDEFSLEPTWYSSEELDGVLLDKLEALSVGQETHYLPLNKTFVVTKLLQKVSASTRPLSEVQDIIEEKLLVEHNNKCYQDYVQQLKNKAVIKLNR